MNTSFLFFAQAAPLSETVPAASSPISIQTALLVVISGALIFLAKSFAALRARVDELEQRPQPAAAPATTLDVSPTLKPARAALTPAPAQIVPPEILTVIAAAIHVSLQGHARIIAITPQGNDRVWSLEGRRQIFHSHKTR